MNEETLNPFDTVGDAPVEARIVAWVLGEASPFEAAELERLCAEQPELLVFRRRMLALHGLLAEAESTQSDDAWKLPPAKRAALAAAFGEATPIFSEPTRERGIRRSGRRALWAIAACVAVAFVLQQMVRPYWVHDTAQTEPERTVDFMPTSGAGGMAAGAGMAESERVIQDDGRQVRLEKNDLIELPQKALRGDAPDGDLIAQADRIDVAGGSKFALRNPSSERNETAVEFAKRAKLATRKPAMNAPAAAAGAVGNAALDTPEDLAELPSIASRSGLGSGEMAADESNFGLDATPPPNAPETATALDALAAAPRARGKSEQREGALDGTTHYGARIAGATYAGVVQPPEEPQPNLPAAPPALDAKDSSLGRENVGRQEAMGESERLLLEGRDAYAKGDYDEASAKYKGSLDKLPEAGVTDDLRKQVGQHLADSDVARAQQNRKVGKYTEARELLKRAQELDPTNGYAQRELDLLEGPIRTNPALTSEQTGEVDKMRRGLFAAEGNFNLGKYDDAKKDYEEVLRQDPYNAAARRGIEQVAAAKSDYYRAAYDQTRAELLAEVDAAWELAVPTDAEAKESAQSTPAQPSPPELMEEIPAAEDPYSTFSLNVSDASFQVAQAALAKGERPDPADVKPEQFYNAVDYGDPAPAAGQPVAATIEQAVHPIIPGRNLVRVALRVGSTGRSAAQPLRLTLLVDQSGSMVREDRRAAMDHALTQLGTLLTENDQVTVIGFSRTPRLLADAIPGNQGGKLHDLINQAANEGGTNLEEALKLGGEKAAAHLLVGAQNRVVLFTDGAANLGNADPARLAEQIKALRQQGIAFDVAGIGADCLNDRLLSELARNGNGRYYVVGNEANDSFARQLAGAFRPAAENVKVQVIFNPQRVGGYKLIGFERDRLQTEDFRNDAVDAAELAADEAGVAIYQVEPLADGTGELGEVSVRFRDAASGEMVERSWTLPYEAQASAFDRATPSMQLAGLSMLAAEKLRGGPLGTAIDFNQLANSAAFVKQFYGNSQRVADMLRVIDALK